MAIPVKNTCTPSSVYGGFQQTLFLGCSVMSFSASQGWNQQAGEITVQLVKDDCASPSGYNKLYYDTTLSPQTTTSADPGFFGLSYDIIGAPAYFRVANFEFSGLIQSWEETHSDSANPTYQVKIVDPRRILEGTQLIINEYAGSVNNVHNLINVYGYAESTGSNNCPQYFQTSPGTYSTTDTGVVDGATFGTPAGSFGGASTNKNGMQWNVILDATRALLSSVPAITNQFSPYGRLVFRTPPTIPSTGMGLMPADSGSLAYYLVDLNDLPVAPSYWRMNGTSIGLMDAIAQICQDAGHDYYVELVPVVSSGTIYKFIKVRTVDRAAAPALNTIDTFIGVSGREVQRYNKGRELRNEITSTFVIGGPKQNFYQAEQNYDPEGDGQPTPPEADDIIIPYFGLDPSTGDVIIPYLDDDLWWEFVAPTDDLAVQLLDPKYSKTIASTVRINEKELIMARAGLDQWLSWAGHAKTDLWKTISVALGGLWDAQHMVALIKAISGDNFRADDLIATGKLQASNLGFDYEVIQIAYAWIKKYAEEYYGKKYQVRVPFTCGKVDGESGKVITSEEPSDGGWTEVTPVIGLSHPSIYTDFFTLEDGRLGAFCRFDNADGLQLVGLDANDFVTTSNKVWVKVDVDEQYVYVDKSTLFSPRAVITLPAPIQSLKINDDFLQVLSAYRDIITEFKKDPDSVDIKNKLLEISKNVNNMLMRLANEQAAVVPDAVGLGIKSNVLKYGPWGSIGAAGSVSVTMDEGLVPWEYGGFTTLNLAGNSIASEGVTNTQVAEEGSITVVGYPDLPLGAELLAADAGGPFNGGGNNLVENRTLSTGTVFTTVTYGYTNVYKWDGTYGPNVTSVTTQVSTQGATTTYNLRTWTPKFGIFTKGNSERLKQIGRQRLEGQKLIRAWTLHRIRAKQLSALAKAISARGDRKGIILNDGVLAQPKTPHSVLVGQTLPWNTNYKRPVVATSSTLELTQEMTSKYDQKAIMSLDGLVRPVSVKGSGGLPRYVTPTGTPCQTTTSVGAQPPLDKPGEAGNLNQYNVNHAQNYLNPFANPSGDLVTNLSDTAAHGHDIEMVARGTSVPGSSIVMPIQGYANTNRTQDSDYASDYRMLALRGPLLMQSWGYDLDGFPVPNKADTESAASGGQFTDQNLQCKFMDGWLRKSHTWPVAPIDLRLDRKRGVWTIPQYRLVHAQLKSTLSKGGTATATLLDTPTLYDCNGSAISNPEIIVKDVVQQEVPSGDKVIAYFDPYSCEYHVVNQAASGTGGSSIVTLSDHNICYPPTGRITQTTQYEFSHLAFGAGLWITSNSGDNPSDVGSSSADIDKTYTINAGFTPLSTSQECCPTGGTLTTDGSRYINKVDFRAGLKAVDGTGNCDLILCAGIQPTGTSLCVNSVSTQVDKDTLYSKVGFGKGLAIVDQDSSDCQFEVGAGTKYTYNDTCFTTGPNANPNYIYPESVIGRGLSVKEIDNCSVGWSAGINFEGSGGCVSGTVINNPNIKNKIFLMDGLRASDDNLSSCEIGLAAGISYYASGGCVPTGSASTNNFKNQLYFMDGLHVRDKDGEPCAMEIAAGIQAISGFGCVNTGAQAPIQEQLYNKITFSKGLKAIHKGDCQLEVGGGLIYDVSSPTICWTGGANPSSQPYPELSLGAGLKAKAIDDCKVGMSAGVEYYNGDGCVQGQSSTNNFKNKFYFMDGVAAEDHPTDPCALQIGAGIKFTDDQTTCVSGYPATDPSKMVNNITLGRGLWSQKGDTDCKLQISAGFGIDTDNQCVGPGPLSSGPINKLTAGKGLEIYKSSDCEARIGLYFDVDNLKTAEIALGDCLKATSGANCVTTIDFADKYADGLAISFVNVRVVTGISVVCCPSGGIEKVSYDTTLLNFNSCGQLINMTNEGTQYVGCSCTDNYSYNVTFNTEFS